MTTKTTITFAAAYIAHKFAGHFDHGWARFVSEEEWVEWVARAGWRAATRAVNLRMLREEADHDGRYFPGYWAGLRPLPAHTSASGRYRWSVEGDTVTLSVCRPQGEAVRAVIDAATGTAVLTVFECAEARHEEYLLEVLATANITVAWVDRVLPAAPALRSRERKDPVAFSMAAG